MKVAFNGNYLENLLSIYKNYSTKEIRIGLWDDKKQLYQKHGKI